MDWLSGVQNVSLIGLSLSGLFGDGISLTSGILGLGFVVFVHELGHFLVAKACGVKCEKFYVGFDVPRALYKFQWGETEYGIGMIPLGGYVKMLGQDDNPANFETEAERIKAPQSEGGSNESANAPDAQGKNVTPPALDPRSYPAKSVFARMAIISAGVIMNVIFAAIFAIIAYKNGIQYTPAIVGATMAGDPLWTAGVAPGTTITQVGSNPRRDLSFDRVRAELFRNDFGREITLTIEQPGRGPEELRLLPSDRLRNQPEPIPVLGFRPRNLLTFFGTEKGKKLRPEWIKDIRDGDRITAVNGKAIQTAAELEKILAANPWDPVTLSITRAPVKQNSGKDSGANSANDSTETQFTVTVPSHAASDYGFTLEMGPIASIQSNSPAAKAKIPTGAKMVAINGKPINDPLALPFEVLRHVGEEIELEIETVVNKNETSRSTSKLFVREPLQSVQNSVAADTMAIDSLGIAYRVSKIVRSVDPKGPAFGKIEAGDTIEATRVQLSDDEISTYSEIGVTASDMTKWVNHDGKGTVGWPSHYFLTHSDTFRSTKEMGFKVQQGNSTREVLITPRPSEVIFDEGRGILGSCEIDSRTKVAESWQEAFVLGLGETGERMTDLVTVLRRLASGKVSLSNFQGPFGIFGMAKSAASAGFSNLLLFLVILSCNLAVMNFLPIPVLDGGHMLFLTWEAISRKPVNPRVQMYLSAMGMIFLLSLMLVVTHNDLRRFLGLW